MSDIKTARRVVKYGKKVIEFYRRTQADQAEPDVMASELEIRSHALDSAVAVVCAFTPYGLEDVLDDGPCFGDVVDNTCKIANMFEAWLRDETDDPEPSDFSEAGS